MRAQTLSDVKGGKDHPLVSRYAGSVLLGYAHRDFNEFVIPLGPVENVGGGIWQPAKQQRVEGQTTRLLYMAPEGRSPLEVLRNYEQELTRAGFQELYRCAANQCGVLGGNALGNPYLYRTGGPLKYGNGSIDIADNALASTQDPRYIAMRRGGPEGEAYVSLFVAANDFAPIRETLGRTIALLDVVVLSKMATGMVTVDAATMAREMSVTGHVALYGILFDTDKAVVKPESEPTLGEIAKLLKQESTLNLYVVGHTDNVGTIDYNMGLSDRRAAAVVDVLKTKYGIAANRLRAIGVGPVAPVASNASEDGRTKNRRVELVRQ